MKPAPAPSVPGDTEAARFDNAVRKLFTVTKQDFIAAEAKKTQDKPSAHTRKQKA